MKVLIKGHNVYEVIGRVDDGRLICRYIPGAELMPADSEVLEVKPAPSTAAIQARQAEAALWKEPHGSQCPDCGGLRTHRDGTCLVCEVQRAERSKYGMPI